jgi:hypothetical protein
MITFKVKPDHAEQYEVVADSRDIRMWEKTNKGASFGKLESPSMDDMYKLAFIASQRTGRFTGKEAEFDAQCVLIFEDENAKEIEPDAPFNSTPGT